MGRFLLLGFIILLGSHLIPFHLRSKGCATSPLSLSLHVGLGIIVLFFLSASWGLNYPRRLWTRLPSPPLHQPPYNILVRLSPMNLQLIQLSLKLPANRYRGLLTTHNYYQLLFMKRHYLNLLTPFIPPLKQGAFWRCFCKTIFLKISPVDIFLQSHLNFSDSFPI